MFVPHNLMDKPIFRPKGMHQKTFDKLRHQQEKLSLQALMIGVNRLGLLGEQTRREIKE